MSKFYFINAQGTQVGPVEKDVLIGVGITRTTMVWKEGSPSWVPASQEPELADFFMNSAQGKIPVVPPQVKQDNSLPYSQKPPTYMWLAICSTILCCLPFGIVSIVYASKVDSNWALGNYDAAYDNSNKAKNWGIASAVTAFVICIIYIIIGVAAS